LRKYGVEDHDHEPKEDLTTDLDAFRRRQEEDLRRWDKDNATVLRRRQPFHKRFDEQSIATNDASSPNMYTRGEDGGEDEGEESWRDGEGQRLKDFGLDEEAEFYDEDDENVPLAELLRRKRAADPK
jgi:palmitoyltransferase